MLRSLNFIKRMLLSLSRRGADQVGGEVGRRLGQALLHQPQRQDDVVGAAPAGPPARASQRLKPCCCPVDRSDQQRRRRRRRHTSPEHSGVIWSDTLVGQAAIRP